MCQEREAQRDDAGRLSLFPYQDECECPHCMEMKMQRDSYTAWTFTRGVEELRDYECWLLVADSIDEMVKIQHGMADLRQKIFEGLQNWEGPAAAPGMVH